MLSARRTLHGSRAGASTRAKGASPPLLLWYVRGLELPLLIDGHDRLRASIAEDVTPRVVQLWQSIERPDTGLVPWRANVVESYERAHQRADRLSDSTRRALNDALVRAFRGAWRGSITTARATSGLEEVWLREVRAEVAGDESDVAWEMLHGGN